MPWRNARSATLCWQGFFGDAALARVIPPNAVGDTIPSSLKLERVDAIKGSAGWTGAVWSAPADPTVPGRSFYAIVERARNLLPGERLRSSPPPNLSRASWIPSAAVLIAEGRLGTMTMNTSPATGRAARDFHAPDARYQPADEGGLFRPGRRAGPGGRDRRRRIIVGERDSSTEEEE